MGDLSLIIFCVFTFNFNIFRRVLIIIFIFAFGLNIFPNRYLNPLASEALAEWRRLYDTWELLGLENLELVGVYPRQHGSSAFVETSRSTRAIADIDEAHPEPSLFVRS